MPRGGKRPGAGRPRSGAAAAREWLRSLCADPERRRLFEVALDEELRQGKTDAWFKAFAQGHGNPPQALDIALAGPDGEKLEFRACLEDGTPVSASALPVSAIAPDGSSP